MSLKGTLETFHLASLLQLLSNDQKTGVLKVNDGKSESRIFMQDGVIIHASSSREELRLGRLLINRGVLTEAALERCLQLAEVSGRKLGGVLVKEELLSLENLRKILHIQVKEVLYSLFLLKEGQFEFKDVPLNVEGKLVTKMNTMEVVLKASRRIDEWSVIKKQIPSGASVFRISEKSQDKKEIKLNKHEWRILSFVDGVRSVREVVEESGFDEFIAYKSLCSMKLSGLVEEREAKQKKRDGNADYSNITSIYNDVFLVVHEDLKVQLGQGGTGVFDVCKAQLLREQRDLFKKFDVRQEPKKNQDGIIDAMQAFRDAGEGSSFLTHSFNTLLQLVLEEEVRALGFQLTEKTVKEIRQALSYFREYQKDSNATQRIVVGIENILEQVERKTESEKPESGGVLSLFRTKKQPR